MNKFLKLPTRKLKPRSHGLTILIDNGYPWHYFQDVIASYSDLIDYIKFGWGTGYITPNIQRKIALAHDANIKTFFGGTFFEKCISQDKLTDYLKLLDHYQMDTLEVSNGTIALSNRDKAVMVKELSTNFRVFSEVGYKDPSRSQELNPNEWVNFIKEDLEAGAYKVITEARESGNNGICTPDGELNRELIDDILNAGIDAEALVFEAPNKELQQYFIKLCGANVNLANIAFQDTIALETLRLGLRSDTLLTFESEEIIYE